MPIWVAMAGSDWGALRDISGQPLHEPTRVSTPDAAVALTRDLLPKVAIIAAMSGVERRPILPGHDKAMVTLRPDKGKPVGAVMGSTGDLRSGMRIWVSLIEKGWLKPKVIADGETDEMLSRLLEVLKGRV